MIFMEGDPILFLYNKFYSRIHRFRQRNMPEPYLVTCINIYFQDRERERYSAWKYIVSPWQFPDSIR